MVAHYLGTTRGPEPLKAFIDHGYIPVDIFMVLSGFVLALTYQAGFQGGVAFGGVRRFLIYRLARIYPLHALTSLVCVAQILIGLDVWGNNGTTPGVVAANLLLIQAWGDGGHTLNAPAWSISTEFFANLLFPWLAVLMPQRTWLFAGGALAVLAASAFFFGSLGENDPFRGAINWYVGPMALMRYTTEFVLGMCCFQIGRVRWLGMTPVLLAVAVAMVLLSVFTWWDIPLVALACLLVIGLAADASPVARFFGMGPVRWLGTVSFSIYLWQIPVLPLRGVFVAACDWTGDPWLCGNLVTMALVIGAAAVSFYGVERPLQRAVRRMA